MYPFSHTHFLSRLHSLVTEYTRCFMLFEGALGSRASGALGTDMNKWTVLHSSMRRAAKHLSRGSYNHYQKDLFLTSYSYYCGIFEVAVTPTHVQVHMCLKQHVVNACNEMHSQY